ncbi:unnamed protein product, partial [Didymodactylos carnosus]
ETECTEVDGWCIKDYQDRAREMMSNAHEQLYREYTQEKEPEDNNSIIASRPNLLENDTEEDDDDDDEEGEEEEEEEESEEESEP